MHVCLQHLVMAAFVACCMTFADDNKKQEKADESDSEGEEKDKSEQAPVNIGDAPDFGKSDATYASLRSFYSYWCNFVSSQSFSYADKWKLSDAENRQVRRAMEKENKKERDRVRREYNDTVRSLARFVKKRDKRWQHFERAEAEAEAKKTEELKARQKREAEQRAVDRAEFAKLEAARLAEQAKERLERYGEVDEHGSDSDAEQQQFECLLCKKAFKSEAQYHNHEQSKAHKEKVKKFQKEQPKGEKKQATIAGESEAATAAGGFECVACERQFSNNKKLQEHLK